MSLNYLYHPNAPHTIFYLGLNKIYYYEHNGPWCTAETLFSNDRALYTAYKLREYEFADLLKEGRINSPKEVIKGFLIECALSCRN